MLFRTYLTAIAIIFTTNFNIAQVVEKRIYYQDENLVPRAHPLDFTHLKLEVAFEPKEAKVIGKVTHDFTVLANEVDTVYLDGPGIKINSVTLDEEEIKYQTGNDGFVFEFGKMLKEGSKHRLVMDYTANPEKGIYFVGWDDATNRSRKQIWTQGQGTDNRHWIPMYDLPNDKVTTELLITMDEAYRVLSNGELKKEKKLKDGMKLWHYEMEKPHATYLIMLGIGDYKVKETKSPSGVPMEFWYYPDWEDRVEPTYRYSEDMMRFMEEETGLPYPWNKYAQIPVQNFLYGAMENTTATVFGDFYMVDDRSFQDRNYVRVNAHELAHQWFGDYVTARTSTHTWLQESFATHYDMTYQGVAFGKDYFDWVRRNSTLAALRASENDDKPLMHSGAGSSRHYPKGAYVLQMLRDVAGNGNYKKAINHYLKKHAYDIVDSEDLLIAFHESTGLSLDWFWEEWIYKGGEPEYDVTFEEISLNGKQIGRFVVNQVQEVNELTGLFRMPIDFEVHFEDGTKASRQVMIENRNHIVEFELGGKKVTHPLFDAGSKVMKKVTFNKPYTMLAAQARNAECVLDRYDAVVAMESFLLDRKRDDLHAIFEKEEFYAVKTAVLKQILLDPQSLEVVRSAFRDEDVEVRKAVVNMLPVIPEYLLAEYESLLEDSSYEVIAMVLEKLCDQRRDKADAYLKKTKNVYGTLEKNVRMKWLEISAHLFSDQEAIMELKDYASVSFEFRTRVKACEALQRLNYCDPELIDHMFNALFSFNGRLRNPVKGVLKYFAEQHRYRDMIKMAAAKGGWNALEQKRLTSLGL